MHARREEAQKTLRRDLASGDSAAFPLVVAAEDIGQALQVMAQSAGIGPLRVNTFLINRPDQITRGIGGIGELLYIRNLRTVHRYGCNIVVLSAETDRWEALSENPGAHRRIDVWWQNDATSRLMLLFAHLVSLRKGWEDAAIRVLTTADPQKPREAIFNEVRQILDDARISARPEVAADLKAQTILDHSADAALVFLPLAHREGRMAAPGGESLGRILPHLPVTALVMAAEDIDLDAAPEEGAAGELAAALDALKRTEQRARKTEENASRAAETARQKLEVLKSAVSTGSHTELMRLAKKMIAARKEAEEAARRAAKAAAVVDDAARTAEDLGAPKGNEE